MQIRKRTRQGWQWEIRNPVSERHIRKLPQCHFQWYTFLHKPFQVSRAFWSICLKCFKKLLFLRDISSLWLIWNTFLDRLCIWKKAGTELVFLKPSNLWHVTFNNLTVAHPIKCATNHGITSKHVAEILNMFFVHCVLGTSTESWTELTTILFCSHCRGICCLNYFRT